MSIEVDQDGWFPFRVVDDSGDGVEGLAAATLSAMTFNLRTQNGTTSRAFTEVDTASAHYEVNEIGDGDYEAMIPGSGGATANNDTEGVGYILGTATGGHWIKVEVEVVDTAKADILAALMDNVTDGKWQTAAFADAFLTAAKIASDAITSAKIADDAITAAKIATDAIAADGLAADAAAEIATAVQDKLRPESGTAQGGGSTSITLAADASASDDAYNGMAVLIVAGTGTGQHNVITDYVGSTKVATVADTWTTNPDNTSRYFIEDHA